MKLTDIPAIPKQKPKRCMVCEWLQTLDKEEREYFPVLLDGHRTNISGLYRELSESLKVPWSSDALRKHRHEAH
jgi:hypothetical protein